MVLTMGQGWQKAYSHLAALSILSLAILPAWASDPFTIIAAPTSQTVRLGQAATFVVVAKPTGTEKLRLTYQWFSKAPQAGEWTEIPEATSPSYTIPTVANTHDQTSFKVRIQANHVQQDSPVATLQLVPSDTRAWKAPEILLENKGNEAVLKVVEDDQGNQLALWSEEKSEGVLVTWAMYRRKNMTWSVPTRLAEHTATKGATPGDVCISFDPSGNAWAVWSYRHPSINVGAIYSARFHAAESAWNIYASLTKLCWCGVEKVHTTPDGQAVAVIWGDATPSTADGPQSKYVTAISHIGAMAPVTLPKGLSVFLGVDAMGKALAVYGSPNEYEWGYLSWLPEQGWTKPTVLPVEKNVLVQDLVNDASGRFMLFFTQRNDPSPALKAQVFTHAKGWEPSKTIVLGNIVAVRAAMDDAGRCRLNWRKDGEGMSLSETCLCDPTGAMGPLSLIPHPLFWSDNLVISKGGDAALFTHLPEWQDGPRFFAFSTVLNDWTQASLIPTLVNESKIRSFTLNRVGDCLMVYRTRPTERAPRYWWSIVAYR